MWHVNNCQAHSPHLVEHEAYVFSRAWLKLSMFCFSLQFLYWNKSLRVRFLSSFFPQILKGTNCPLGRFFKGQFQLQCGIGAKLARPGSNPGDYSHNTRITRFSFWTDFIPSPYISLYDCLHDTEKTFCSHTSNSRMSLYCMVFKSKWNSHSGMKLHFTIM